MDIYPVQHTYLCNFHLLNVNVLDWSTFCQYNIVGPTNTLSNSPLNFGCKFLSHKTTNTSLHFIPPTPINRWHPHQSFHLEQSILDTWKLSLLSIDYVSGLTPTSVFYVIIELKLEVLCIDPSRLEPFKFQHLSSNVQFNVNSITSFVNQNYVIRNNILLDLNLLNFKVCFQTFNLV